MEPCLLCIYLQRLEDNCILIVNNIKNAVLISYLTLIFSVISGIVYTPWMVSQLGQSDYGLYSLVMSIVGFFAMDFGLGLAVSKFLSDYKAKNDINGAKKFLGTAYRLFLIISFFFFFALIVFYFLIDNIFLEFTHLEIEKLKDIFLIAGLFSVVSFMFKPYDGILIANERFVFIKLLDLFHKILVLILMVVALLLDYGLYALVIVNAIVGLIKIFIQYRYIKKYTDTDIDFNSSEKKLYIKLFNFSGWTTIASVAQRFILLITPIILGALSGTTQIALFSIAMVIEGYVWMISSAMGGLFLPRVTQVIANKNSIKVIENLMIKVGRLQLLVVGLLIIGFIFMGKEFIVLWMGKKFMESYYIVVFLIVHSIIVLPQQIAQTALIAKNKMKYRAFASLITVSISLSLTLLFVPEYGALGAAFSIFIGNIFGSLIYMNVIYSKLLKLNILRFFTECHLNMLMPLLLTVAVAFIIQNIFQVHSLAFFLFKVLLIGIVYSILMWKISLNIYEKELIRSLFDKFNKKEKHV